MPSYERGTGPTFTHSQESVETIGNQREKLESVYGSQIEKGESLSGAQQAVQTAVTLPTPPVQPQISMPLPPAPVDDSGLPVVAGDDDLIEKEWVASAKKIIAETKDDPYKREQEVMRLQADYLKKRYGRDIGEPHI